MTGIDLHVSIEGFKTPDFDSRIFKLGLRKGANKVKLEAKRKLSHRGLSAHGDYPGKQQGIVQASIAARLFKGGFTALIDPKRTPGIQSRKSKKGKPFYPTILTYGSTKHNIAPRKDPVKAAYEDNADAIKTILENALYDSLSFRA